jgi:hypothetical protein
MPRFAAIPFLALLANLLACTGGVGAQATPNIQAISDAVRAQEESLLNLQVAAHCDYARWDGDAGEWTYAGEADLRAWLSGAPGSKLRMDYERSVAPWVDGPAPFGEDSYRDAFNGRATKHLQTRMGVAGLPGALLRGELKAGSPVGVEANGGLNSGWRFSALGVMGRYGVRLSDYLALARQYGLRVEVFETVTAQRHCIGVRVEEPNELRVFYLDPDRAYALAGAEFIGLPSGQPRERLAIYEMKRLASGLYYPTTATSESFDPNGHPRGRSTWHAHEIVVNDPAWTDDIFDPEWPPGTFVDDQIAGTTYEVGQPAQQIEAAVDKQIGGLLEDMRTPQTVTNQPAEAKRGDKFLVQEIPAAQSHPAPASIPSHPVVPVETKPVPQVGTRPVAPADSQPATQAVHTVTVYSASQPQPDETARGESESALQPPSDSSEGARSHATELWIALLGVGVLAVLAVVLLKGRRAGLLVFVLCVALPKASVGDVASRVRPGRINSPRLSCVAKWPQRSLALAARTADTGVGRYQNCQSPTRKTMRYSARFVNPCRSITQSRLRVQ